MKEVAGQRGHTLLTVIVNTWRSFFGLMGMDIGDYVDPVKCRKIEEAFRRMKEWKLTSVREMLCDCVSYEDARIVRG